MLHAVIEFMGLDSSDQSVQGIYLRISMQSMFSGINTVLFHKSKFNSYQYGLNFIFNLLFLFYRELPNPLCTYQLYQSFVNAVQGCSIAARNSETDHERLLKMREAVQKLPPPHYR